MSITNQLKKEVLGQINNTDPFTIHPISPMSSSRRSPRLCHIPQNFDSHSCSDNYVLPYVSSSVFHNSDYSRDEIITPNWYLVDSHETKQDMEPEEDISNETYHRRHYAAWQKECIKYRQLLYNRKQKQKHKLKQNAKGKRSDSTSPIIDEPNILDSRPLSSPEDRWSSPSPSPLFYMGNNNSNNTDVHIENTDITYSNVDLDKNSNIPDFYSKNTNSPSTSKPNSPVFHLSFSNNTNSNKNSNSNSNSSPSAMNTCSSPSLKIINNTNTEKKNNIKNINRVDENEEIQRLQRSPSDSNLFFNFLNTPRQVITTIINSFTGYNLPDSFAENDNKSPNSKSPLTIDGDDQDFSSIEIPPYKHNYLRFNYNNNSSGREGGKWIRPRKLIHLINEDGEEITYQYNRSRNTLRTATPTDYKRKTITGRKTNRHYYPDFLQLRLIEMNARLIQLKKQKILHDQLLDLKKQQQILSRNNEWRLKLAKENTNCTRKRKKNEEKDSKTFILCFHRASDKNITKQLEETKTNTNSRNSTNECTNEKDSSSNNKNNKNKKIKIGNRKNDFDSSWVEYRTTDGQPYYHNHTTCITQWDKPMSSNNLPLSVKIYPLHAGIKIKNVNDDDNITNNVNINSEQLDLVKTKID